MLMHYVPEVRPRLLSAVSFAATAHPHPTCRSRRSCKSRMSPMVGRVCFNSTHQSTEQMMRDGRATVPSISDSSISANGDEIGSAMKSAQLCNHSL